MEKFEFRLLTKVKSTVTGLMGIIVSSQKHLNGCSRYEVQPYILANGKVPSRCWYDEIELEVVALGDGSKEFLFPFKLGAKVKSVITGFSGIVTSQVGMLNGTNMYWVDPPVDDDNKVTEGKWVDECALTFVGESCIEHAEVKTGGPSSSIR